MCIPRRSPIQVLTPTATPLPITPKKYVGDAVILMVLLIISYKNISKTIVLYYNEFLYYHEIKYQNFHYRILVKQSFLKVTPNIREIIIQY